MKRLATETELDDGIQYRFQLYRARAEGKSRDFELSYQEFKNLLLADCAYCGRPSNKGHKFGLNQKAYYRANGVDRIDNAKGYVTGNVVSCCWLCNESKCEEDVASWLQRIREIYRRTLNWSFTPADELYSTKRLDTARARNQLRQTNAYHAEKRRSIQD